MLQFDILNRYIVFLKGGNVLKLLALDANSIINRAYYGIRPLSTKEGVPTNAIYGFMNILLKLIEDNKPDVIVAAFDLKAPTFRHKMYADYKAGRKPMPDDLRMQIPIMKQVLEYFGCVVLEKEGYEADDILGTMAKFCDDNEYDCVIATGDRDSLQLVTDKVHVLLAATKSGRPEITEYTPNAIQEKYGVSPVEMIEIKALQGDSSDNIPGVAGVGEKTAGALISKYHSIEYIYDNIDSIDEKETLKNKLLKDKEKAFLSKELGTICKSAPVALPENADINALRDVEKLKSKLIELEMSKLLSRLSLEFNSEVEISESIIEKREIVFEKCEKAPDNSVVFYDEESDKLFAQKDGSYYIITSNLKTALASKGLIVHDAKSLYHFADIDYEPNILFDTMLAAYLISPDQSDYDLSRYATVYGVTMPDCDNKRAVFSLDVILAMYNDLSIKINELNQHKLLREIEIPLAYTLYRIEKVGFCVDKSGIIDFGEMLKKRIDELELKIFQIIGYEFNLNSPKQLGVALFEKLGLPCSKKTKTGYSTSAEVLEGLRHESEAVEYLLEYRSVSKLKSTYCDGLVKQIESDGRIHSVLKQTETRTGRISSAEPNLQNIPVRTELGRQMRKFFIADSGKMLVDADYSQIELRVLASVAEDKTMIDAFKSGDDIHAITASQVFGIPLEMMTSDIRSKAKAVNFGIVYGIGAFSLSKDINVTVAKAKRYIEDYLSTYSGVRDYLDKTVENAKTDGFVTTYFGRRRYLPELKSSNFNLRAFGERVAKNMPIQGAAADIIKIAMINVDRRLTKENLPARLIMQVHDELIVECDECVAEKVSEIVKYEMESAVSFAVKLTCEVKSGKSWFDTK